MKKQNGQVIVEFALILPLLLLFIFGIFYSGMLFHDYSTLSNIARSAARERAISTETDANIIKHYYEERQFKGGILTSLYRPASEPPISFTKGEKVKVDENGQPELDAEGNEQKEEDASDVIVTISMQLNVKFPLLDVILPEKFDIVYHMRKDS